MPNVIGLLKTEILRLAEKEAKCQVTKSRKAVSQYRREVAELKRLLRQREQKIKRLRKSLPIPADDDPLAGTRFSARSVRHQRQRLGLSADDYGRLIGVTALAVRSWENGKSRPRKAQLARLVALRGIPKKEAMAKLAKKR